MNTARKQVKALINYYLTNRAVGHTTAMIDGVIKNTDTIVVVTNEGQAKNMRQRIPDHSVMTLTNLDQQLAGIHDRPIVLDNDAIFLLLARLLEEIDNRDSRLEEAKKMLHWMAQTI